MTNLSLFGVPAVLADLEVSLLVDDLTHLWRLTYGEQPETLQADLAKCRRLFDPSLRGFTLRERLSQVETTPPGLYQRMHKRGEPLVIDTGDQCLIVGVEARLALAVLSDKRATEDHVVLSWAEILKAENTALRLYREWCLGKISQIIDLRSGAGKEVLQAPSVGLIIALLINRSTTPETAIVDLGDSLEGDLTSKAVHFAALRFAERITTGRKKSTAEHKLTGGYIISEARRRLAHRLAVESKAGHVGRLIYIPQKNQEEVIGFLGKDLARRPNLDPDTLKSGLKDLVLAYRSVADDLANQSMLHERPADTTETIEKIFAAYLSARS